MKVVMVVVDSSRCVAVFKDLKASDMQQLKKFLRFENDNDIPVEILNRLGGKPKPQLKDAAKDAEKEDEEGAEEADEFEDIETASVNMMSMSTSAKKLNMCKNLLRNTMKLLQSCEGNHKVSTVLASMEDILKKGPANKTDKAIKQYCIDAVKLVNKAKVAKAAAA